MRLRVSVYTVRHVLYVVRERRRCPLAMFLKKARPLIGVIQEQTTWVYWKGGMELQSLDIDR